MTLVDGALSRNGVPFATSNRRRARRVLERRAGPFADGWNTMKNTLFFCRTALLTAFIGTVAFGAFAAPIDDEVAPPVVVESDDEATESTESTEDDASKPATKASVKREKAPTTVTGRVLVKLNKPVVLTREPTNFESIFEPEKAPKGAQPGAAPAANGANVRRASEFVGREIADFRVRAGNGKYMLEDEFGEIRIIPQSNVASVEPAPDASVEDLRKRYEERLLDEFGEGFQVKKTEHFILVSDASEGYVDWCGRLFESLEEGFRLYARRNGIELTDRGEPLIVVVFARQVDFIRYASVETGSPDKLAAYYNMQTNRVALYDLSNVEGTGAPASSSRRRRSTLVETREILSRPNAAFNVATVVHEATHQIAFNRGLFLRTGPIALWAAEGLSLVFETPNGHATQGGWGFRGSFPKNERMINLFRAKIDTVEDPFRTIVAQENFYQNLEASYAASWALFYYLYKKNPNALAKYLRHIASKSPCTVYSAQDRLKDFEEFFGDDWEKTTAAVKRYVKRL